MDGEDFEEDFEPCAGCGDPDCDFDCDGDYDGKDSDDG